MGRPKGKPYRRKLDKLDLEGNFIQTYESINKAAEENYINAVAITNFLAGKSKTCAGYLWRYADEE